MRGVQRGIDIDNYFVLVHLFRVKTGKFAVSVTSHQIVHPMVHQLLTPQVRKALSSLSRSASTTLLLVIGSSTVDSAV